MIQSWWAAATGAAGMGAGTGALATGAGKAPGTTCRHESQVEIECIDCMEKVDIA